VNWSTGHQASLKKGKANGMYHQKPLVSPLENLTLSGFLDLILLRHGVFINKMWPVHPESTMAVS
jgi:hypothetical protein